MVDAGLAVAMAVTVTITIAVSPGPGRRPDALAYGLGLTIAALLLAWRRWPLAVLLGSVVILQLYYVLNYPGIFPAVPLSVALCAAWTAGHQRWALLAAVWFLGVPVAYRVVAEQAPPLRVLGDEVPEVALLAAVLLLAEAIRSRHALALEQQRSEQLLLNVLPAPIADRLKQGEGVIADAFPEVTVLFADIVDFTGHSQHVSPQQVVQGLNQLFSAFDRLARRHGLEKIKTIGDAYMVAGGLPDPRPDHAQAVAEMALAIRDEVARRSDPDGEPLAVRIGIDTGPAVAGMIGTDKFSYDLWGNTVNTASRMESHGVPGHIQVTARTYRRCGTATGSRSGDRSRSRAWASWSPISYSAGTYRRPIARLGVSNREGATGFDRRSPFPRRVRTNRPDGSRLGALRPAPHAPTQPVLRARLSFTATPRRPAAR